VKDGLLPESGKTNHDPFEWRKNWITSRFEAALISTRTLRWPHVLSRVTEMLSASATDLHRSTSILSVSLSHVISASVYRVTLRLTVTATRFDHP